jgi:hypothetical protein
MSTRGDGTCSMKLMVGRSIRFTGAPKWFLRIAIRFDLFFFPISQIVITGNSSVSCLPRILMSDEDMINVMWTMSSKQASKMMQCYTDKLGGKTNETIGGLQSIIMNILGSAAYSILSPLKTFWCAAASGLAPLRGFSLPTIKIRY